MGDGTASSKTGADLLGNRKFESISLQQRVSCEPESSGFQQLPSHHLVKHRGRSPGVLAGTGGDLGGQQVHDRPVLVRRPRHQAVDDGAACLQLGERAHLVARHQPAVAGDIGCKNGSKFALYRVDNARGYRSGRRQSDAPSLRSAASHCATDRRTSDSHAGRRWRCPRPRRCRPSVCRSLRRTSVSRISQTIRTLLSPLRILFEH
jgi:hypothetical protein